MLTSVSELGSMISGLQVTPSAAPTYLARDIRTSNTDRHWMAVSQVLYLLYNGSQLCLLNLHRFFELFFHYRAHKSLFNYSSLEYFTLRTHNLYKTSNYILGNLCYL